ncbi:hypothetical protein BCV70DRAFT_115597 [Testicularia cyperi]|uniref:DASH complex subunit DAD1 n=1 Tax=Testicularia cyperi TaxID=1882483 RepID=A0A317XPS2_9BASI|nr:hypothetical protein BCV70DRAFT_115597 [Testicularia cyperi]
MSHVASQQHDADGDAGFFERERLRLIQDISKGVESILGNSNILNRRLEESLTVGKDFHPIAQLWSKFEHIMAASGIPNLHPSNSNDSNSNSNSNTNDSHHSSSMPPSRDPSASAAAAAAGVAAGTGSDAPTESQNPAFFQPANLPPGVAPGGGRIYN